MATGSSLMPQKKNPDPLELVRGKSGRVIGRLAGWLTTMKGLPSGYNKDLQEDKEAVFDAEDQVLGSLRAAAAVVESIEARPARSEAAAGGMLLATDVADYLVDPRRAVPARARDSGRHRARPARAGARFRIAGAGGMATLRCPLR